MQKTLKLSSEFFLLPHKIWQPCFVSQNLATLLCFTKSGNPCSSSSSSSPSLAALRRWLWFVELFAGKPEMTIFVILGITWQSNSWSKVIKSKRQFSYEVWAGWWLWRSWQSGHLWPQRSAVQIQPLTIFSALTHQINSSLSLWQCPSL